MGTTVTNYGAKIEWFGTVRLRAGYVWGNEDVFSYVTGALAYGKVDLEGTSTASGFLGNSSNTFSVSHSIGHSNVNTGGTLGYGTEGRLVGMPGWTWRVESYYMDLGHLHDTDECVDGCIPRVLSASGGQVITNTHFTDWILRGGLSYQFH